MKPVLALTLISLMAARLSQLMSAQHSSGVLLPSIASTVAGRTASIPLDQIGVTAGKQYSGDGVSVRATEAGARLRCVFQRLEGEATPEGLWLTSTVTDTVKDRFRVVATAVMRGEFGVRWQSEAATPLFADDGADPATCQSGVALRFLPQSITLPRTGMVAIDGQTVRFVRLGLIEEYSVSTDGVRQDFVIEQRSEGEGELCVELAVTGAKAEPWLSGARFVLDGSGRKIAYSRLRVTDATGRELAARIVVGRAAPCVSGSAVSEADPEVSDGMYGVSPPANTTLAVIVNDADALYPIRVDPTFSDANWTSMSGILGVDGFVYATVVDESGNLYIGGSFTNIGNGFATNIAKWNGNSWSALGSGMNNTVRALAMSGSLLYAGGDFTEAGGMPANRIAKWNGSGWSALGSGMNSNVTALAVSGNLLCAGGDFTMAGGSTASRIARWNGSGWSALGSGMNSNVTTLAVSGSDLYAGGAFTRSGGIAASNIAKWDGSSWSALGLGMNGPVRALAVLGSDLYAGGTFTTAGGITATNIAKWDGSSWSALSSGIGGISVYALSAAGSDLYAGGSFTTAGGMGASYIAKWDGNSWSVVGSGMNNTVRALAVAGSDLYAGGSFMTADGNAASRIAQWNGSSWSALGEGIDGPVVLALAVSGGDLYAGGQFTTPGNRIAKWNGSNWSGLGEGMNGNVIALAVLGGELFAGGLFTTAGGNTANYIAKWNGNSWSTLGSGMNSNVYALAVSGSDLYAGGAFTTAGSVPANCIAKWNGNSWSALGSGMNSNVFALAVSGGDLYAGGQFTTPGNRIAKWNGSIWSPLGFGLYDLPALPGSSPAVYALAVSGSAVYAGGSFDTAGGVVVNRIAKWDGSNWSALSSGMNGLVETLAVSSGVLYAGGWFTTAGGTATKYVSKWDGNSWSALGSGMNNTVQVLALSGSDLYAAGNFTVAGGKVSARVARVRIGSISKSVVVTNSTASIHFSGVTGYDYDVQRATSLNAPFAWTTVSSSPLSPAPDGSFTFTDTNAPPGAAYYRAVER